MLNIYDAESLEKYSSAVTLSDMEIFIFPELMFSLVLANIMSPTIWKWKQADWFSKMDSLNDYRKVLRVKQYIMDNYDFNLDLDTWGLTKKDIEKERFKQFVDDDTLSKSNALFGYEGDKYYFDMDIRKHFGLEKYDSDTIPYWKTETPEAMENFYRRPGYKKGAGECVSFSTLYYAALFIMAGVPTEKMYMIATPLHSQNFVEIKGGLLTNNRRLVTKNMWFNGTVLSHKAKRALVNEHITFIANSNGYIHRVYDQATLPQEDFENFQNELKDFLVTDVSYEIIANFLREFNNRQCCFQFETERFGKTLYIPAEDVYRYEHRSPYQVGTNTQSKLLDSIEEDDFYSNPLEGRVSLKTIELFFKDNQIHIKELEKNPSIITDQLSQICKKAHEIVPDLLDFCKTEPMLPSYEGKTFKAQKEDLTLRNLTSREEIISYLRSLKDTSEIAGLAFMAYREVTGDYWYPFLKAALERNPVSIEMFSEQSIDEAYQILLEFGEDSIYSENRLAQPDEVANFRTGDGIEKAILLWNLAKRKHPDAVIELTLNNATAVITGLEKNYEFATNKNVALPEKMSEMLKELGIA
ncbi:hypothetical protein JR334_08870 [Clostridia bacterium]|nr:hypothetical protein JR334_08870 [Clostridia bacterium]